VRAFAVAVVLVAVFMFAGWYGGHKVQTYLDTVAVTSE
jgi:hypothetical protein